MAALEKAKLQEVSADANETTVGDPVSVQFNPTSLQLKLTNKVEGGRSRARQRRQHNGSGSTVLSMELVFDSADDGTDAAPVSVRTKTAIVEKYVVPLTDGSETPPRLRFEWNDLVVSGIVENLNIDFDLFAADGTPLRAKVRLSIKEQEAKYQFLEAGAGNRNSSNTNLATEGNPGSQPGGGTNDPSGGGGNNSDRSATALEGESPVEFAARMGLDPSAWRGLDVDLGLDLSLEAGVEIGFSAGLSLNAGVGVTAGIQAGVDISLEAAVGLDVSASASATAGVSADAAAGFALSSAGGVSAAIETVKISQSTAAAEQAQQAFAMPSSSASASSTLSPSASASGAATATTSAVAAVSGAESSNSAAAAQTVKSQSQQAHTPLTVSGSRTPSQQQAAAPAPTPPKADARSSSYGFGVPLRPLYKTLTEQQQPRVCGHGENNSTDSSPPFRSDPTTAPWVELPRRDSGRDVADAAEKTKHHNPCNFGYSCSCKRGGS